MIIPEPRLPPPAAGATEMQDTQMPLQQQDTAESIIQEVLGALSGNN
jgi:hypothetical protein